MLFRNDIQGLRAIAFLLVFIFHLNATWLPGGFLGVDLFFVISGYLITCILVQEEDQHRFSFLQFFQKRLFRIVPAYLFMLLFVVIAGAIVYLYVDIKSLKYYLKNSLFFISNTVFSNGESYFGAKLSENPLLHTWSLAIEMQFYLILPFLVHWFRKYLWQVFLMISIILIAYSSYNLYFLHAQTSMYFSLWARIPEFLIGGLFALWFKNGIDIGKKGNTILAIVSFLILLTCSFLISESSPFPGILAVIPCIASALLLVTKNHALSSFFSHKIMVKIGEYSYSLYLWHWPVMAFIRYKYETYDFSFGQIIFILFFTILMSYISYQFIESVFRKKSNRKSYSILATKTIVVGSLIYFLPHLTAQNKIDDFYTRPTMGLASHKEGIVERFGDVRKQDKILLIGNSNALMLKPFFDKIGKENGFSFRTLTSNAFPAIEGVSEKDANPKQKEMYAWSQSLIPKTKLEVEKAEIIFFCTTALDELPSVTQALKNFANHIRPDQKLVLMVGFPTLDKSPIRINNSFLKKSDYSFTVSPRWKDASIMQNIAKGKKNIFVYNVAKSSLFKSAPYAKDTIIYYDNGHLNTFGSLKLAESLEKDFMNFYNTHLK
ncbi:MAG: acyltransferase [Bacteroidetes bacterium]|nr:acyltransferase [Bacteroidota bacterium]